MMAARAGADTVIAVEQSSHMCSVAEAVIAANGLSRKCTVLQRDARRMFAATSDGLRAGRKPDGAAPELERKADMLVFEVFDSGLIGEGALHLTAMASHRLLLPDATIVPAAARVYCQPLQFRLPHECCGVIVEHLNQYNWRPDYDGVMLARRREDWVPLAEPQLLFDFDFANAVANCAPATCTRRARATHAGILNAVAVWFELVLDDQETLSTSPYSEAGPTWQNAITFVKDAHVRPGDDIEIVALHDTYAITVTVRSTRARTVARLHPSCTSVAHSAGRVCRRSWRPAASPPSRPACRCLMQCGARRTTRWRPQTSRS